MECPHREDDIDFLKRKVDMGVDFLTTQMFFDNDVLYRFLPGAGEGDHGAGDRGHHAGDERQADPPLL